MVNRTPPKLATVLRKLLSNAALTEDLREAYVAGKSDWWYWRQVSQWVCATTTAVTAVCVLLSASAWARESSVVAVEPLSAIISTFQTHNIVALTDPHGNVEMQALLLALVRDPRFVGNDIVLETVSARYQDAIDRFVRGDDVLDATLQRAWREHSVPSNVGTQAEELIRAVRQVNAMRVNKIRVIAGDPPIDWDNVLTPDDHHRWIELRDSYPADLIRRQVLDRARRALVIYGQGHLQRRQIVSNYDMSTWQEQTVISLAEQDPQAHIFNVWTLLDKAMKLPNEVASWRVPSLALLKGTSIGGRDFAEFGGYLAATRFAVREGHAVAIQKDQWKVLRFEEQFDAILYLGSPESLHTEPIPTALCRDSQFTSTHLARLLKFGAPPEAAAFRSACGL